MPERSYHGYRPCYQPILTASRQYGDCLESVEVAAPTLATVTNYTRNGVATSAKDRTVDAQMANAVYTGLIDSPFNASSGIIFQ